MIPDGLRSALDHRFRDVAFGRRLGIEVVDWDLGRATVRATPGADDANLVGTVHGGLVFALADAAFEIACNSYGRVAVALETATHYVAAAPVDEPLVARATEVSRTRRTASYRIDVVGADGTLRAWLMALAYRTNRWHVDAEELPDDWDY